MRRFIRSVSALVVLGAASAAHAQLIFQQGSGGYQDISNLPGVQLLNIPFNGSTVITTSIGNPAFPAGQIKVSYNLTAGSNVGASEALPVYAPLPSTSLYDGKNAMAVIWDTPAPAQPNTAIYFLEFTSDPLDTYYIIQWTNLPLGQFATPVTAQLRVNDLNPFRSSVFAQFSYLDVEGPGIEGGGFATIGYQNPDPTFDHVQWSFNQPFAIRNGTDLILTKEIPAPGALALAGITGLLVARRRR
jgi:hypothetical protein